jgi:hypothetical protein
MFPPYYSVENLEDDSTDDQSSTEVTLESFANEFPVLDHCLLTSSEESHYRSVRGMILQLHTINNAGKSAKCLEAMKLLFSSMPVY